MRAQHCVNILKSSILNNRGTNFYMHAGILKNIAWGRKLIMPSNSFGPHQSVLCPSMHGDIAGAPKACSKHRRSCDESSPSAEPKRESDYGSTHALNVENLQASSPPMGLASALSSTDLHNAERKWQLSHRKVRDSQCRRSLPTAMWSWSSERGE